MGLFQMLPWSHTPNNGANRRLIRRDEEKVENGEFVVETFNVDSDLADPWKN
jgi:hypothetical protein